MIEPIKQLDKEYLEWQEKFGVTKFIDDKTGEGHRGVIVENNDTDAVIYGLTGIYAGQLVRVKEEKEGEWPIIIL